MCRAVEAARASKIPRNGAVPPERVNRYVKPAALPAGDWGRSGTTKGGGFPAFLHQSVQISQHDITDDAGRRR